MPTNAKTIVVYPTPGPAHCQLVSWLTVADVAAIYDDWSRRQAAADQAAGQPPARPQRWHNLTEEQKATVIATAKAQASQIMEGLNAQLNQAWTKTAAAETEAAAGATAAAAATAG